MDGILRPGGKMKGRDFPISVDPQVCAYMKRMIGRDVFSKGGREGGVRRGE